MADELQSLSALFQNRLFRIPGNQRNYQRDYAWKHEQIADFWECLVNLRMARHHYAGMLVLKAADKSDVKNWNGDKWIFELGFKPFHVVDGQQRLTTISILIHEITAFVKGLPGNERKADHDIRLGGDSLKEITERYIFRKNNAVTTYIFGYEAGNHSANYMKHNIFDEPLNAITVFLTGCGTNNLEYAKKFFAGNLAAMYKSGGILAIERLYEKLTLRLMFDLHEIEDDRDAFAAFETMNNRGEKLTDFKLLKNRLTCLAALFDDAQNEQLRQNINSAWKEINRNLRRNNNAPLSEDDFLRAHWITYFRHSRDANGDCIRFLLGKFSAENVLGKHAAAQATKEAGTPSGFEQDVGAANGANMPATPETDPVIKLAPSEINDYVNSLKFLAEYWRYSFFPHDSQLSADEKIWIEKLNRIGIGYFRPLVAAALSTEKTTSAAERLVLFKSMERFIFVSFMLGGFRPGYKSRACCGKARDLLTGAAAIASIAADLDKIADSGMDSAMKSFIAGTNRRFDSGGGFNDWRGLHYFLFEYEFEKAVANNLEKVNWNLFTMAEKGKVAIEHILPQTMSTWYWRNMYRAYTPEEIKLMSASIGNLLPLSQSIHSPLQNDSFHYKKNPPSTIRRGYVNGSHSEMEVAPEQDWTADNILARGMSLLNFMEERWRLDFESNAKRELLHIPFVGDGRDIPPEPPKEEKKTIIVSVSFWQMQCCGKPFSIYDRVEWIVGRLAEQSEDSGDVVGYYYEHHDSRWRRLFKMVGTVEKIRALCHHYAKPDETKKGAPEYEIKAASKRIIDAAVADGYVDNGEGWEYGHYEVYLKECIIRPAKKSDMVYP